MTSGLNLKWRMRIVAAEVVGYEASVVETASRRRVNGLGHAALDFHRLTDVCRVWDWYCG